MENSLVSVVMPCFNAETWLRPAVESVLSQTHRRLELILYNDGSTDDTLQILKYYQGIDDRVKVYSSRENKGIVHSLNYLIERCKGEFIARMDADDICMPNRLDRQIAHLKTNNLDVVGSWILLFGLGIPRICKFPESPDEIRVAQLFQNPICHPCVLARVRVYQNFLYRSDYEYAEDYDLFSRASHVFDIGNVPEPLLKYRRSGSQITASRRREMDLAANRVRENLLQKLGVPFNEEEVYLHGRIRNGESILHVDQLKRIEDWLYKLLDQPGFNDRDKGVIASQWVRACIRAAPLGVDMMRYYSRSKLRELYGSSRYELVNMALLSILRIPYESRFYSYLSRFGLAS